MIEFTCTVCHARLRVSEAGAGKLGRCLTCGSILRVQKATTAKGLDDLPSPTRLPLRSIFKRLGKREWAIAGGMAAGVLVIVFWKFVLAMLVLFALVRLMSDMGIGKMFLRIAIRKIR